MSETTRKISEIAEILSISEDQCKVIAEEYEVILPCKKIGKVRVYEENIIDRFRKVADLKAQGLPKEVIIPAIRGGKSLEERALEDMKRMGIEVPKDEPKIVSAPIQVPKTETETELILAVRSAEASVHAMDHRLSAMRERISDDNRAVLDAVAEVSTEVVKLRSEVHMLWDQIASLEKYFREQNEMKEKSFWKR